MNDHGHFVGEVKCEWLVEKGPDRNMILLEDFGYVDPTGKKWPAPKGSEINGASIPRAFWISIGPPYVGNYRRASVVHDVACVLKEKVCPSSQIAHRMFYDAALCGGVSKFKAGLMYWAVRKCGPKWGDQDAKNVLTPEQYKELIEIDDFLKSKGITQDSSEEDIQRLLSD